MKIKTTLKKIKRGDILKINWIDATEIAISFNPLTPSVWVLLF